MANERGLTLLELIVTVAIVAVLSGIAIVSTKGLRDGFALRAAARLVYSDLQLARLKAIKEGKACALEFSGNTYVVKTCGPDKNFGTGDDVVLKRVDLPGEYKGMNITSTQTRNIFYPNGTAGRDGGSSTTVTLSNGTRTRQIFVATGTGSVRIQ